MLDKTIVGTIDEAKALHRKAILRHVRCLAELSNIHWSEAVQLEALAAIRAILERHEKNRRTTGV